MPVGDEQEDEGQQHQRQGPAEPAGEDARAKRVEPRTSSSVDRLERPDAYVSVTIESAPVTPTTMSSQPTELVR